MSRIHRLLGGALVAAALVGTLGAGAGAAGADRRPSQSDQVTVYGLTAGGRIATFPLDKPHRIQNIVKISGVARNEKVVGLDRRPANDTFYVVGQSRRAASLYTVDPSTGAATLVAPLVSAPTATSPNRTPVSLDGTEFGFDFNPAADALRIVSDTGQNLRVIPSARTAPDGTQLQPGDTFTDGALNQDGVPVTGVTGAAYTNNDTDPATATVLYDINADRDDLSIQNPPNAGTLTSTVPLGKTTGPRVGFDIRTVPGTGDLAVASLSSDRRIPSTRIVVVDLATGDVDSQGRLLGVNLRDIALAR